MTIEDAFELINREYESDDGLHLLFRMSADIDRERLETFVSALNLLEAHYTGKVMIEKNLIYKLISFYTTLNASARHWIAERPKGLDKQMVYTINRAILDIFSTR